MNFKIQPEASQHLCRKCSSGTVAENESGRIVTQCEYIKSPIPFLVTRCTSFQDRTDVDQWTFEKIAWHIDVNKKGEFIGFKPPKKRDE